MVKSFQRFANAAAVGMPSLVAATHGDPHCYEKTLKVGFPFAVRILCVQPCR